MAISGPDMAEFIMWSLTVCLALGDHDGALSLTFKVRICAVGAQGYVHSFLFGRPAMTKHANSN